MHPKHTVKEDGKSSVSAPVLAGQRGKRVTELEMSYRSRKLIHSLSAMKINSYLVFSMQKQLFFVVKCNTK